MLWPKYRNPSPYTVSMAHLKFFVSDTRSLKSIGLIALLILLYLLGIHLSLPFADVQQMQHLMEQSLFLSAVNVFFTGGALGNVSPLALGILPLIFLYSGSARITGSRLRIQPRLGGRPLAIIGPYGHVTSLALNEDGYLEDERPCLDHGDARGRNSRRENLLDRQLHVGDHRWPRYLG